MFSAVEFECSRAFGSVQLLVFAVFVFDFPNIPAVVLFLQRFFSFSEFSLSVYFDVLLGWERWGAMRRRV